MEVRGVITVLLTVRHSYPLVECLVWAAAAASVRVTWLWCCRPAARPSACSTTCRRHCDRTWKDGALRPGLSGPGGRAPLDKLVASAKDRAHNVLSDCSVTSQCGGGRGGEGGGLKGPPSCAPRPPW